jgi:RNA polymerase sigma factor (sigma-70 family)
LRAARLPASRAVEVARVSSDDLTAAQHTYIRRLAHRLIGLRRSAAVDVDDLMSAATARWWQFCIHHPEYRSDADCDIVFREQVKFAMRDILRTSAPVKLTRADQAKLAAYETVTSVPLEQAAGLEATPEHDDYDLWLDVVAALQRLSEREQLILSLHLDRGLTFTEIAYAMQIAVSTATRSYQGALQKIKKDLAAAADPRKISANPTEV